MAKLTQEEFIKRAKEKFPQYDYSRVEYINGQTKVKIVCPDHGEWEQIPANFLRYKGCPKCANGEMSLKQFVDKASKVHSNKYDYSLIKEYKDTKTKVKIICPEHGEFEQIPGNHLQGAGCIICSGRYKYTNKEFIEKAQRAHNDKYDYSLTKYNGAQSIIKIICPTHGIFKQAAYTHLYGVGCPICCESKGERETAEFLTNNNIKFEREKKFNECKNTKKLPFDFYLPDHNICIEYDGEQHFKPFNHLGGKEYLKYIQNNDTIKTNFCKNSSIKLIRIRYDENVKDRLKDLL